MNAPGGTGRKLTAEILDELPPDDPHALRSRRDLRRINTWMGNVSAMAATLEKHAGGKDSRSLFELGSGDGSFLARLARRLGPGWKGTRATLLDRQPAIEEEAMRSLEMQGWLSTTLKRDVFEWAEDPLTRSADIVMTNLFLHHFEEPMLRRLLDAIAARTNLFVAIEPRRSRPALFFSRFVWVIGCNAVTQHDAVVSVQAGFAPGELSRLWPEPKKWHVEDRPYGWSNHLFMAKRLH